MDKRLLTALLLSFLFIWGYNLIFPPPEPVAPVQTEGSAAEAGGNEKTVPEGTAGTEGGAAEGGGTSEEGGASKDPVDPASAHFEASSVEAEETVTIDTDIYRAVFSNNGGVLKSLKLKNYFINAEVQKDATAMADPANWFEITGEVKDGAPCFVLKEAGVQEGSEHHELENTLWEAATVGLEGDNPVLTFTLRTGDGLIFRKIFSFHTGSYHLDFRLEMENLSPDRQGSISLLMDAIPGIFNKSRASLLMGGTTAALRTSDERGGEAELITQDVGDLDETFRFTLRPEERLHFAGLVTNYFCVLLEPGPGTLLREVVFDDLEDSDKFRELAAEFERERGGTPNARKEEELHAQAVTNVAMDLLFRIRIPAPGGVEAQEMLVFAGPKHDELMEQTPYDTFYPIIEDSHGSFGWINVALLGILKFFHNIFGNWGVAIIFLTLVVKILLFPINRYQQLSMHKYQQKMAKMKPKLEELKKRFKNNKKKYNEEQMKLMKKHGATPPLMGCLVMFLQFPIFIGLFQALRTSFELRHSPFCLWIKDLSQPDALPLGFTLPFLGDTLNVVPLAMTLAFFFQQKAMPKPTDPQSQQTQKIMMFMPFLFLFMFYSYASGLSLYWMTSNLITIFEYKFIRKKFPVAEPVKGK
jgi:YidC/Oxa1 family membrane protein insertase